MSITDELREYAGVMEHMTVNNFDPVHGASFILSLADRIDAEHEKALSSSYLKGVFSDGELAENGFVRLPKDADGEHICVGDKLDGYGKTIEVVELRYGRSGWVLISRDGNAYADTFAFTHHHAPTVEDVLREFYSRYCITKPKEEDDAILAEYAAKLRLAGDAE